MAIPLQSFILFENTLKMRRIDLTLWYVAICAMPSILFAQDTNLSWTPSFMVGLDMVESSIVSPDGRWVAYTIRSAKTEGEDSKFISQLWVSNWEGTFNRQFTHLEQGVGSIQFSPDNKNISFLSMKEGKNQIFLIPIDGGESYAISQSTGSISAYKWSPNGKQIAYIATEAESEEDKKAKKEKRDVILVDKQFKFGRIYNLDVSTKKSKLLYNEDLHATSLDWSPDGKQIAFSHQPTPRINDRYKSDISLVSSDSGAVVPLVIRVGTDDNPLFTRDGQSIVFSSSGGQHEPIGLEDIFMINLSTKAISPLPKTHDRSVNLVGIDASGNIIYTESIGTQSHVCIIAPSDRNYRTLTKREGVHARVSMNSTGTHLSYTFEDSELFREIYAGPIVNHTGKQISNLGKTLELPKMGKTEHVSWQSKDGKKIEALFTYPINYVEGQKVPLILMVHGGPAGVYSRTWTGTGSIYAIQYFAEKGYALLRPNPRGSTGYGKEFRYDNFKDWGFGDYEDLMSGVDHVINIGVADPDNLFEMGWSYGGYMTSWIVTQTDRFKAVSMGAGLSNLTSMTGTTDIPDYLTGHMGGPFWNGNWDTYQKHSAIYYVEKVKTPTQIIHGKEDLRVPIGQAQEFYWALGERNIPTEMIVYPRTPHGPREPKFLADVSERIMTWFEQYRK